MPRSDSLFSIYCEKFPRAAGLNEYSGVMWPWRQEMSSTSRASGYVLVQASGVFVRVAQVQLGHGKTSRTLEVYTLPIPAHPRKGPKSFAKGVEFVSST